MKIKDFDEKVRIGTKIVYSGKVYTIQDINRKTHEALIMTFGFVRCSEFELYEGGDPKKYRTEEVIHMGRIPKKVQVTKKDGTVEIFDSVVDAANHFGVSEKKIRDEIYRHQNTCNNQLGVRIQYIENEKPKKESSGRPEYAIIATYRDGTKKRFKTAKEASEVFGYTANHIRAICRGEFDQREDYTLKYEKDC